MSWWIERKSRIVKQKKNRDIKKQKVINKNIIVVSAAGNDSQDLNKINYYPAAHHHRIVVVGNKSRSSNYGDTVDVIEDGNNVKAGGYRMSGSSQSTSKHSVQSISPLTLTILIFLPPQTGHITFSSPLNHIQYNKTY